MPLCEVQIKITQIMAVKLMTLGIWDKINLTCFSCSLRVTLSEMLSSPFSSHLRQTVALTWEPMETFR